jgi:hypothetical protein
MKLLEVRSNCFGSSIDVLACKWKLLGLSGWALGQSVCGRGIR